MSQVLKQGSAAGKQAGPSPTVTTMPTITTQPQGPGIYMIPSGVVGKAATALPPHPAAVAMATPPVTVTPNPGMPAGAMPPTGSIAPAAPGMVILQPTNQIPEGTTITSGILIVSNDQLNGTDQDLEENLANTKEKTPMCLINELARHNKIQHQYTLTGEQGPAHKKTFFVDLKLGEEEYAASGASIKKTQHAAAAIALEKTQYKHPPPKPPRKINGGNSITPTVELNALVMKRGEPAIYRPIEMPRPQYYPPPNFDFRGMYNQRYHYPRYQYPRVFYVSLKVGQQEFIGEGNTRQAARHSAAAKALKALHNMPAPNMEQTKVTQVTSPPVPPEPQENGQESSDSDEEKDALKSEISLVHEIALKRNLPVNFEVIRESGPPHMRTFVTRCTVGEFVTEGEGKGKKISKKRAAEKMLEELKMLPTLPPTIAKPKRNPNNKKKNRNLIKVNWLQKADPNYGVGINPISRLIQIQQAKKEKEPVYMLVAERGKPRHREFVMEVQVGEHRCPGVGPNKKLAKRKAAEEMLQLLGYSRPSPQPSKPAIKQGESQQVSPSDKKVTFMETEGNPIGTVQTGRQLVPGLLLMPDGARTNGLNNRSSYGSNTNPASLNRAPGTPLSPNAATFSPQTTATIAKELLDTGSSPTAESLVKSGAKPQATTQSVVRPRQQLLYLADILGFQVHFTDFPKGSNKNEFLSLVSLSTDPPHVSHGAGLTTEESHDLAALTALKALSDFGINAVTDKSSRNKEEKMAAGDGPHVKTEVGDTVANSADLGHNAMTTEPL